MKRLTISCIPECKVSTDIIYVLKSKDKLYVATLFKKQYFFNGLFRTSHTTNGVGYITLEALLTHALSHGAYIYKFNSQSDLVKGLLFLHED